MKISREQDNGFNVKDAFEDGLNESVHWSQTKPDLKSLESKSDEDSTCWTSCLSCFGSPLKCNPKVRIVFRGEGVKFEGENSKFTKSIMQPKSRNILFKATDGFVPFEWSREESTCQTIDKNTQYMLIQVLDDEARATRERTIAECLITFSGFDATKENYANVPIFDAINGDESGTVQLTATFVEHSESDDKGNELQIYVNRILHLKDPTAFLVKEEDTVKDDVIILISWLTYMSLSIIFYVFGEDFTFIDALYLRIVTAFTVGYGDMYPVTNPGKLLNCLFIIIDTVTIGFITSKMMNEMLRWRDYRKEKKEAFKREKAAEAKKRQEEQMEQKRQQSHKDLLEVMGDVKEEEQDQKEETKMSEEDDLKETEKEKETSEAPKTAPQAVTKEANCWRDYKLYVLGGIILIFITIGTVVMVYVEGYDFASAFEWNFVTLSTVGYGDVTPQTTPGKIFTIFYIMFGVSLVVFFGTAIFEKLDESRQKKFKEQVMKRALISEAQLLEFDVDGDGKIDKYEFLSKMLVETQEVEQSKIDEIMVKFKMLDADNSGTITTDELREIDKK
eukprot:503473_1